jgi:hypothetical protein
VVRFSSWGCLSFSSLEVVFVGFGVLVSLEGVVVVSLEEEG